MFRGCLGRNCNCNCDGNANANHWRRWSSWWSGWRGTQEEKVAHWEASGGLFPAERAVTTSGCSILAQMMRKFQNYLLHALLEQLIDSIFAIYSSCASPFIEFGLVGVSRSSYLVSDRRRGSGKAKGAMWRGATTTPLYYLPMALALAIISSSQPAENRESSPKASQKSRAWGWSSTLTSQFGTTVWRARLV